MVIPSLELLICLVNGILFNILLLFCCFLGLLPQLLGVAPEKAIKLTVSLFSWCFVCREFAHTQASSRFSSLCFLGGAGSFEPRALITHSLSLSSTEHWASKNVMLYLNRTCGACYPPPPPPSAITVPLSHQCRQQLPLNLPPPLLSVRYITYLCDLLLFHLQQSGTRHLHMRKVRPTRFQYLPMSTVPVDSSWVERLGSTNPNLNPGFSDSQSGMCHW